MASFVATRRPLASLFSQSSSSFSAVHAFSTTLPQHTKTIKPHRLPDRLIPPYPYGERRIYKQSNRGLYGSARIRFGNRVAEKYGNKCRRFWRPNVHVKSFYVPSLDANIKTRLTLRVLKTIYREGGLQPYLLKSKPARLKELGPGGWNLRWLVMQTRAVQEQFNQERVALGLPTKPIENRDDVIQYALDFATPGPLSVRSQKTLEEIKAASARDAFVLGDEDLADLEGVEELTAEEEAQLLKELDLAEAAQASQGSQGSTPKDNLTV
ncbi:hypothetical protein B0T10DRAFT_60927 [Thelonectria olida]|uniref:Uncharacterized protein n=1 Tax=Thelonectria olida TaxID=1576542 RepID=A0A9P8W2Y7_9HYPO|nr:hypothetical protein B0T10DRAFT_60927 [Thelonectria olida]